VKNESKQPTSDIPNGWEIVRFGDIALATKGKKPHNLFLQPTEDCNIPYIDIKAFEQGVVTKWTDGQGCVFCEKNDVLLVWDGSRSGLVGRAIPGAIGSTIAKIYIPLNCKTFLYYFLSSKYEEINAQVKGSGTPHVNPQLLWNYLFPLPPLPEQHRIVAKIEQLFSALDKGVAELKAAKKKLELYRQSLLKAAFEGRLTEKWRRDHADELESTEELLARIKAEREKRYQQQLGQWKQAVKEWEAQGKPGKKPKKPRKPKELPPLTEEELAQLPKLPEGWVYTYLSYLGDLARGKSKHRPRNDPILFGGPYPFIQTGDVKANHVITNYSQTYNEIGLQQSRLWPKGTLCITIAANIAETAFLGIDACFPDSIVGFTNYDSVFDARYINFFIQSVRKKIDSYAPATAQKNINLKILEELVVPYCSILEQKEIVQLLELASSTINHLTSTIDQALARADLLRQAILKKAFSGQLVPQDPNDEPASELLKRIRAEREVEAKKKKTVRKRRKRKEEKEVRDLLSALKEAGDWISAHDAFRQCGISDGAETDQIEPLYMELRDLVHYGKVLVERRGEEDWLKLKETKES